MTSPAADTGISFPINRSATVRGFMLISALAVLCGACFVYRAPLADSAEVSRGFVGAVGVIGAAGFAVLAGLLLRRCLSNRPYVVVTSEGIFDNGSGIWSGVGWIGWEEVADIRVSTYRGHPSVELIPANRAQFRQRFSRLGWIDRTALGDPPVVFRPPLLSVPPEELAGAMRKYWRGSKRGNR